MKGDLFFIPRALPLFVEGSEWLPNGWCFIYIFVLVESLSKQMGSRRLVFEGWNGPFFIAIRMFFLPSVRNDIQISYQQLIRRWRTQFWRRGLFNIHKPLRNHAPRLCINKKGSTIPIGPYWLSFICYDFWNIFPLVFQFGAWTWRVQHQQMCNKIFGVVSVNFHLIPTL